MIKLINRNYVILLITTVLLCVSSCQKVINIAVNNATPQLVIEGNITNITAVQYVKLRQTVPFSNTNVYPPVSGATVTVTDSKGIITKFTESATAGTYASNKFAGRPANPYTITVVTNNKTYTAGSTMPGFVNFDQLTYRDDFFNNTNSKLMTVHFQDPPNIPNQYRFIIYVNNVQVKTIFVANDSFTDGGYVDLDLFQSDITIKTGDNVSVEMQCIDAPVYTYFFSLSQQNNDGAGGGTTPSNPPSNFNNNALGYFSAHTTQTQTLVIN